MTINEILVEIHKLTIEDRLTLLSKIKKMDDPRIDEMREKLKDWNFSYKNSSTNKSMHITFTKGEYRIDCNFIYKNKSNHFTLHYKNHPTEIMNGNDCIKLSKIDVDEVMDQHIKEIEKQGYTIIEIIEVMLGAVMIRFKGKYDDEYSVQLSRSKWRYQYYNDLQNHLAREKYKKYWSIECDDHRVFKDIKSIIPAAIHEDKLNDNLNDGRLAITDDYADPNSRLVYLLHMSAYEIGARYVWEDGQDFILSVIDDSRAYRNDHFFGTTYPTMKMMITEEVKQEIMKKIKLMKKKLK